MIPVVFIRHGQSVWNFENRFTGWTDVGLTEAGRQEALAAGRALKRHGYKFDRAFTSVLTRAIETLDLVKQAMGVAELPSTQAWQLNERHYGALQGLNKKETADKYGADQVHLWRRGYAIRPPALEWDDERHARFDNRYRAFDPEKLPSCESLQDTMRRTCSYWREAIMPYIQRGERVLVVAHGNSLRALVKDFDAISDEDITELNIPTGVPLVYEFDQNMHAYNHFYLMEDERLNAAV